MEGLLDILIERLTTINWAGPGAFVAAILVVFTFLKKFSLVLLITLTIVIGWGAEDLMISNLETSNDIISAPLLVYAIGGVTVFFLILHSFFKSN